MPFVERWTSAERGFDQLLVFRRHLYSDIVRLADCSRRSMSKLKQVLSHCLRPPQRERQVPGRRRNQAMVCPVIGNANAK
jgi:hypothetical protein